MLTRLLARTAVVVAAVVTAVVAGASAAQADSHLSCPSPHHCVIEVGSAPGGGGADGGNGGVTGGGGGTQTCDNPMHACYVVGLGWWSPADQCWYMHVSGDDYIQYCYVGAIQHDPVLGPPAYVTLTDPPDGYGGPPDPLRAAAEAINALAITGPRIVLAPTSTGVGGLVGLPVWMSTQVGGAGDATWGSAGATASIPGLSATATATAQRITWDMGDGHTVVCDNPGTSYHGSGTASPDCGYTYRAPSDDLPGGRYTITATTTWMVTWTATDGAHGWVTVDATSTTTVRISDLQVVVA